MQLSARVLWTALPLCLVGGTGVALVFALGNPPSTAKAGRAPQPAGTRSRAAARLHTFTFVAGGDIALTGDADAAVFAGIRRFLRHTDLAVANLEGTLATGGAPKCVQSASSGCFTFRASPAWAATLRATGFTVLNVANNHALDYGIEAKNETLAALRRARITYQGLPGQIAYVHAGKVKVALIGCAPYRWAQSLLDMRGSRALVRKAARHADVVLVYMHAGAEGTGAEHVRGSETYLGEPRGNAREFAHAMIESGADLVFASGPHILRGIEWYRRRLVAYSLANLASTHTLSTQGSLAFSALLRVRLDSRGRFAAGFIVPLRLVGAGRPVLDGRREAIARIRILSREDFGARAMRLSLTGRLVAPRASAR